MDKVLFFFWGGGLFSIHSCSHTIGSCYTHLLPYFYITEILYFYLNVYIVKCNCIYVIHGFENNTFFFLSGRRITKVILTFF